MSAGGQVSSFVEAVAGGRLLRRKDEPFHMGHLVAPCGNAPHRERNGASLEPCVRNRPAGPMVGELPCAQGVVAAGLRHHGHQGELDLVRLGCPRHVEREVLDVQEPP